MKIDDFSYIICENCGNVKIFPISYEDNHTVLSNMCKKYNEMNECCDNSDVSYCDIRYGIEENDINLSDLPLKLRKEFQHDTTYIFDCGKYSLEVIDHTSIMVSLFLDGTDLTIKDVGTNITRIHLMED